MKELKFNIKYLINRKELYFVIFLTLCVNLIHVFLCINESLRLNHFIEELHSGEYQFILYNGIVTLNTLIILVFPVMFSMVFSDSNFLENKRKTTNILATRINFKKNIIIRMFLSIIVTFIICFFTFLINYIILRIIYGTGNRLTFFQETAFHLKYYDKWFLDNIRLYNPIIFVLLINLSVSFIYGLLSALSYLVSFFVRNRIIIYFVPLIFLIATELFLPILGFKQLSFITALQPFSEFSIISFVLCICFLLLVNTSLLFIIFQEKDVLI
ncbi:MAG: hypothetical protein PHC65_06065 [Methanobacteriaceae archaeon]|nr:hypothetical protein [Methanobacteriaceae archaeon]MDD3408480.1 hypothetical protein [Methanobacteriaceae archaeon]